MITDEGMFVLHIAVSTVIRADPVAVANVYRDYDHWSDIFPLIHAARLLDSGDGWSVLEIDHAEGRVINLLSPISSTEISLIEAKRLYDARFLNIFEPCSEGTHYLIEVDIWFKKDEIELSPSLEDIVGQRITELVSEPIKKAVEATL